MRTELPCLSTLRSSKAVQRQIDKRVAEMDGEGHSEGNTNVVKIKSKRRGSGDVLVEKKMARSHKGILGWGSGG